MLESFDARFRQLLKVDLPLQKVGRGVPVFAPSCSDGTEYDQDRVDRYTGRAFGHKLFGLGWAEGLYRTIEFLLLSCTSSLECPTILDAGCGVGRVLYDCAPLLPRALFVGAEASIKMCERAEALLVNGQPLSFDYWRRHGFMLPLELSAQELPNVRICQCDILDTPFVDRAFDCVMATLILDRVSDPVGALSEFSRLIAPGGWLLLSTPLNFRDAETWSKMPDSDAVAELINARRFRIHERYDGLIYREVVDRHLNFKEWSVSVFVARKTAGG